MHRNPLLTLLKNYRTFDQHEQEMVTRTIDFVQANPNCFERTLQIGHITGSAWIIDETKQYALLMHHQKLDRWFQPGGHADGETNILEVAIKEATEETGLSTIKTLSNSIFDVDIHLIPENKKEAAHFHYDIRFLFEADKETALKINSESKELKWIKLAEIKNFNNSESMMRMVRKINL